MDWGIVASVLVALALFTATVAVLASIMIGLFVGRLKKRAGSQGGEGFKFPGCPLTKSTQNTP